MNSLHSAVQILSLATVVSLLGGCANVKLTHIPPGESMNAALAKKAELIRLPAPVLTPGATGQVPAVEPELPGTSTVERVAEAYSRGEFCLSAGKDEEAIAAFEEAVKIDPTFTEAWQQLAMIYEKKGSSKKAMEAFRRSKKIASH
jgi:Tfp pilus assembly protein PilF